MTEEKIVCKLCGHETGNSLQSHLKSIHKLSPIGYREEFPEAMVYSSALGNKLRKTNANRNPSYKIKLSEKVKEFWRDPNYRKEHSVSLKIAQNKPEVKERHRKGALKYFENRTKEQELFHNNALKKSWEATKGTRIKSLREAGKREDSRLNRSIAMRKFFSNLTPEQKEQKRQILRNTWKNPELREKILKIAKYASECSLTPDAIRNRNEANKKPEVREKRRQIALKRLMSQPVISSLNIKFKKSLNDVGLFPLPEQSVNYYCVDFLFPEKKIIVEVDGNYWHGNPLLYTEFDHIQRKTMAKDKREATYCKNHGYTLIRFWESDVQKDIQSCIEKVKETLNASSR